LAAAPKQAPSATDDYASVDHVKFYEIPPFEKSADHEIRYARGQHFVLAYIELHGKYDFERPEQPDEYIVLLPEREVHATISALGQSQQIDGYSLTIVPPGKSTVSLEGNGRAIILVTAQEQSLLANAHNAESYGTPHPRVAPYRAWPESPAGPAIRSYSLDIPPKKGRLGRIFRSSNFMVNCFYPANGPRDPKRLSPHAHDDFEQCSLSLEGKYVRAARWPWGPDSTKWRPDVWVDCDGPTASIIAPGVIHTGQAVGEGLHQNIDIFCPPRLDFSQMPGWVLNEEDYPLLPAVEPSAAPADSGRPA